jgi:hypothetical protein
VPSKVRTTWPLAYNLTYRPLTGGGTQVKWNRQDDHILASAHGNDIFIWDTRVSSSMAPLSYKLSLFQKGSLPISRITAHSARVYGIDWKLASRTELITCSVCAVFHQHFAPKPIDGPFVARQDDQGLGYTTDRRAAGCRGVHRPSVQARVSPAVSRLARTRPAVRPRYSESSAAR